MRFLNSFSLVSHFVIRETKSEMDLDMMVSLPVFAMISGTSVSEVDFERINIRVKPEFNNRVFYDKLKKQFDSHFEDYK